MLTFQQKCLYFKPQMINFPPLFQGQQARNVFCNMLKIFAQITTSSFRKNFWYVTNSCHNMQSLHLFHVSHLMYFDHQYSINSLVTFDIFTWKAVLYTYYFSFHLIRRVHTLILLIPATEIFHSLLLAFKQKKYKLFTDFLISLNIFTVCSINN